MEEISKMINNVQSSFKQPSNCTACSAEFNMFRKPRKQCFVCKEAFCSACLLRETFTRSTGNSDTIRRCNRCRIFSKNELEWNDLMQLRSKDLIWFLNRQNIPSGGMKEKEQLAELILEYYGSETYYRSRITQQRRVAEMASVMEGLRQAEQTLNNDPESNEPDQENVSAPTQVVENQDTNSPPPISSEAEDDISLFVPGTSSITPTVQEESVVQEEEIDAASQPNESLPIDRAPTSIPPPPYPGRSPSPAQEPSSTALCSQDSTPAKSAVAGTQRVLLQEIQSEEDVELLSVKQLKDLLAFNFVDYKGCVERHELLTRAKRLWRSQFDSKRPPDTAAVKESSDGSTVPPEELVNDLDDDCCRICMDASINCVLLECGHMVTCVQCGKRLSECPICRQYIVRTVRIFRS